MTTIFWCWERSWRMSAVQKSAMQWVLRPRWPLYDCHLWPLYQPQSLIFLSLLPLCPWWLMSTCTSFSQGLSILRGCFLGCVYKFYGIVTNYCDNILTKRRGLFWFKLLEISLHGWWPFVFNLWWVSTSWQTVGDQSFLPNRKERERKGL
jgi:hypothetical protein